MTAKSVNVHETLRVASVSPKAPFVPARLDANKVRIPNLD